MLRKYPANSIQSTGQEKCDDVHHVHHHGGSPQQRSKRRQRARCALARCRRLFLRWQRPGGFSQESNGTGRQSAIPLNRRFHCLRQTNRRSSARLRHRWRNHHVDACDFVYSGESAKFQMPFINLALLPEFGTSYSIPARIGYLRAAELIQLGQRFDAQRAAELGLVTRVVPDQALLATATETAQKLAEKPAGALQACKKLMRQPVRPQLEQAAKLENEEYAVRLRSADAKEAFTAFLEKRQPNFTRKGEPVKVG